MIGGGVAWGGSWLGGNLLGALNGAFGGDGPGLTKAIHEWGAGVGIGILFTGVIFWVVSQFGHHGGHEDHD